MTRTPAAGKTTTSPPVMSSLRRTLPKRKARQLAKHLRDERPDYVYLKAVFRALRDELGVDVQPPAQDAALRAQR